MSVHGVNTIWYQIEAYKEYAKGTWTILRWTAEAKARGYRSMMGGDIQASMWHRMLTNPFYKGIVSSPEWGIEVQGKHEALVALEPAERDAYLAEARRVLQEAAPEGSGKEAETLATDPDNGITPDEFRQERERLNERIDQAQFALRRLTQQREHAEENIAAALEGLVHLDQAYHDMPLKLRRELVRCVFRRLIVEGGCIVSIEYNRPFAFVARCKIARHSSLSDSLGPPTATLSELLCD